jgi:hypothetical protein
MSRISRTADAAWRRFRSYGFILVWVVNPRQITLDYAKRWST